MSRRRRNTEFLGTSFLDLLSCALGGVLLLVLVLQQSHQSTVAQFERDKQELAEKLLDLKRGMSVPLPLAVQIHWEGAGDIDLMVVRGEADRVFYGRRRSEWGELMRDEREGQTVNNELFFSPRPAPGEYLVCVSYYDGGERESYDVTGEVALYPGDVDRARRKRCELRLATSPRREWIVVAAYTLTESAGRFEISFAD